MRLYGADWTTFIPAPILEYVATGYADRTENYSETGSAETVHDLILDYVPKQDGTFSFSENDTAVTVIPWGETPVAGQVAVDFDTGRMRFYGHLYLLSCIYTPLGSCLTQPLADWIRAASAVGYQHSTSTANPHSTSLQQVTGGSFSINSGDIVSTSGDISIKSNGDIITAGSIIGDLFGNINQSTTVGTTGPSTGRLATVTTWNTTNNFGRTTMDGATLYQSLRDPMANDTTYYKQTCSVSGQPNLLIKTPASATSTDIGTVRTQLLVASLGTYGEWVEYPYRNGSQTATYGAVQLVSGTTPYMTIPAAQIERGAQFRVTGFFKRTQITTNYTDGGGLRIVPNVGTGYVQPKTLILTTQTSLTFAVDFVLTAVDNGSGSWQLLQSVDATNTTTYAAIITVPKSTDVPLYLWTSTANTVTLGTDIKDYVGGFQVYRLR